MEYLELKNINTSYNSSNSLDNISFKINKGDNISIVGGMSSFKSTLTKVLGNDINYNGTYLINGVEIVKDNSYLIDRYVGIISTDIIDNRKIVDILFDSLDDVEDEEKIVNKFIKDFNLVDVDKKINEVGYDNYYYTLIIASLIRGVSYLVLDDVMCYLNKDMIDKILKYIKKKKISLINITSNIKEVLYSSYSIYLYLGKVVMEGEVLSCLREEKLLKRIGFNLPFMVDLSTQLMYYSVLDKVYLDDKDLVDAVWN